MFKLEIMLYETLLCKGGEDKLTYDGAPNKKASLVSIYVLTKQMLSYNNFYCCGINIIC